MTTENKQRLTLLTSREVAAADTGGSLDEQLDEKSLLEILKRSGRAFDAGAVLDVVRGRVGWYRLSKSHKDIPQREITEQARATAAVIDELMTRLTDMHPDVYAHACAWMLKHKGEMAHAVMERVKPDLSWLGWALKAAADAMPEGKGGRPADVERDKAYREVYEALLEHCKDDVPLVEARALAADLLLACGVDVPDDDRKRERVIKPETR